jgi:hypothetical protein
MPTAVDPPLKQLRDLIRDAVRAGDDERLATLLHSVSIEFGEV